MQHANYNETNGIIVGPEISRIFAEIILQAVDLAILRELKEQYGYRLGRDYEIRRYVDDSYVYATSREILENVCTVYQEQLAFYKWISIRANSNIVFVHLLQVSAMRSDS